jgi:ABC-type nitrate/sulfonate/bicarbonate transport system substrate-binding protein
MNLARYLGALLLCLLLGCSRSPQREEGAGGASGSFEVLELRYQGNNGTVTPAELAEDLGYLAPIRLEFVGSTASGPQSIQTVVTGDTDFGGAFNGAVIKLVLAKAPIRAVIGYYGVDDKRQSGFYVLEDSPIRGARDLLGKKVSMNTLGAHSEFMLKEYLFRQQVSAEDARQVTMVAIPPINGEQILRQGQVNVAALGDIFRDRALERGGIRSLFSDYDLYGAFTAGSYVMKTAFIERNPNTARKFVEATARALEWSRQTPREQVIERFQQIMAKRGRNEDASILKYWRSYGVAGKGGLITEREFQVWIDWMIRDGELQPGQLAVADLYTNDLNPFAGDAVAQPGR